MTESAPIIALVAGETSGDAGADPAASVVQDGQPTLAGGVSHGRG